MQQHCLKDPEATCSVLHSWYSSVIQASFTVSGLHQERSIHTLWYRLYVSHKLSLSSPACSVLLFLDVACLALQCVERQ